MSPKCLSANLRREIIRDHILLHNYEELAHKCHCTKRTIIRDIEKWRKEGGFEQFLYTEFFKLYSKERLENPSKALDRVVYLLRKQRSKEPEEPPIEQNINVTIEDLIKDESTEH